MDKPLEICHGNKIKKVNPNLKGYYNTWPTVSDESVFILIKGSSVHFSITQRLVTLTFYTEN